MKKKEIDPRVVFVQEEFEKRVKMRENIERGWLLNLNFYAGNQNAEVLPTGELTVASKKYAWQEAEVFNHIAPIIEARLSKFANIRAQVSVLPASNDTSDIETAKFSTKLIRSVEEENNLKKLVNEATFWSELTGTAFYKVVWAPNKGRCVLPEENLHEGDVEISVCPPYEIYPDNMGAGDVDGCRSIIHAKAYPVSVVEDLWGVKPESCHVSVIQSDNIIAGGSGITKGRSMAVRGTEMDDYVTVIERYSVPDSSFPEGRLLIVAGDKLLYDGVLPYKSGEDGKRILPFIRQACISQPSCFYGTSIIERMIPVQRAYNAVKNRKHEFFNRLTAGVLIAEDGSVDFDELEEDGIAPGKVLVYRQGSTAPIMENLGEVPSEFGEEEEKLLNEFVSISGVSDFLLSSGYTSNNLSGTAINLIMQQDNNRLALCSDNIRFAVKEIGKQILLLYKQFATACRMKKIYGDNGKVELLLFTANSIGGGDVAFDVEEESVNSSEIRKQTVREIFEMGLMRGEDGKLDDASRLKMIEMMGLCNWQSALSIEELHKKKAMRENLEMENTAPKLEEIDNHTIHIMEHTRYLLEEECPLSEEKRKELLEHLQCHKKAIEPTI